MALLRNRVLYLLLKSKVEKNEFYWNLEKLVLKEQKKGDLPKVSS